jgi:hypothetical protein
MPHPLVEQYEKALYELPEAWRARRVLEDEVAKSLTGGRHAAIRGFWRIGKTELMKGALKAACARTGGAAFFIDLRDAEVVTPEGVRALLKTSVEKFLKRVGVPADSVAVDANKPWAALGELEAAIFVGVDELIALKDLGPEAMTSLFETLFSAPKNVHLVHVAHRHQAVDAAFNDLLFARPDVDTFAVPVLTDEEAITLVNAPCDKQPARFSAEAAEGLAVVAGHRPWEIFTLCLLAARTLADDFTGELGVDKIEPLLNLDVLTAQEEGQSVVENYLRILATAMSPGERTVIDLLAVGGEGEATEDAVVLLEEAGWITSGEGYALRGTLFEAIANGVASGEIRVKVEP